MKYVRKSLEVLSTFAVAVTLVNCVRMIAYMHSSWCWYVQDVLGLCDSRMFGPITVNLVFIALGLGILGAMIARKIVPAYLFFASIAFATLAHLFNYLLVVSIPSPLY